jgi:hypothetical protein
MLLTPGPSSPGTLGPALADHRIERGKPRAWSPLSGASSSHSLVLFFPCLAARLGISLHDLRSPAYGRPLGGASSRFGVPEVAALYPPRRMSAARTF